MFIRKLQAKYIKASPNLHFQIDPSTAGSIVKYYYSFDGENSSLIQWVKDTSDSTNDFYIADLNAVDIDYEFMAAWKLAKHVKFKKMTPAQKRFYGLDD